MQCGPSFVWSIAQRTGSQVRLDAPRLRPSQPRLDAVGQGCLFGAGVGCVSNQERLKSTVFEILSNELSNVETKNSWKYLK